jgi:hypothetical protein
MRDPLAWILFANVVLHGVGIWWGLPSSTGWDDDGVAPRDFLPGVVETFRWGSHYTYPPLHLVLLTVLTLPVWVTALLRARSLGAADLIAEFTKVPYMTAFSVVARATSVFMAVGIVYALYRLAEELWGRRAGLWAALVVTTNIVLNYYAHTSNLDVPYLFWATLALAEATRAVARSEPRRMRTFAILAALSICTKDQAYGLFVLSVPALVLAWVAIEGPSRARARGVVGESALALVIATALVLVIDGALFNPLGFRARLAFLTGAASRDHAVYPASPAGWAAVARDTLRFFDRYYPWPLTLPCLLGVGLAFGYPGGARSRNVALGALLPLAAALSFTLTFNMSARRTEHRFLLPQMLMFGVYGGAGTAWLVRDRRGARIAGPLVAALLIWAAWRAAAVDAAMLLDPRYDAETWMRAHVRPVDSVETYGNDAYLPRFPPEVTVTRVGPEPLSGRSVVPGIREVRSPYGNIEERRPRFIVLADGWAWRYWDDKSFLREVGTALAPEEVARERDIESRSYFRALVQGRLSYRSAHVSEYTSSIMPVVDIHSSTDKTIRIFERADGAASGPSSETAP